MFAKTFLTTLIFIAFCGCQQNIQTDNIKFGLDVLVDSNINLLQGKRIGVITNQTGVNTEGKHIVDLLFQADGVELVALFGPEHGIRGNIEGGFKIDTQVDNKTGVPILSLYGKTKKPTPEMLENIDLLIFDIQDIGTRFYTYISTMSVAMEAAAENNIPFMVLDRPNPIMGAIVEGPVLEEGFESFVGIHKIALRHGMTIGELAVLFNEEKFLANGIKADLTVVKLENWKRNHYYNEFGIEWIKPSPNIPDIETAFLYPGIGLLEATIVSEGRGTTRPFKNIGAPWLNNVTLLHKLQLLKFEGISVDTTSYVPVDMPGIAMNPKFEGQKCFGLQLSITDPYEFQSAAFGINLICLIKKLHPDRFAWRSERGIDIMSGTDKFRKAVDSGKTAEQILKILHQDVLEFKELREKYLLYE